MITIIFEQLNNEGRVRSIIQQIEKTTSPVIVFSRNTEMLMKQTQSLDRSIYPVVGLFHDTTKKKHSFNPIDIFDYIPDYAKDSVLSLLLEPLTSINPFFSIDSNQLTTLAFEPSWRLSAMGLFQAVVSFHIKKKNGKAALIEGMNYFFTDNVPAKLHSLIEKEGKLMGTAEYAVIESFLDRSKDHQSMIITMIISAISCLNAMHVQRAIESTTFDLETFVNIGTDVFIELPSTDSDSYIKVIHFWFIAFMQLATNSSQFNHPILFIIEDPIVTNLFPKLIAVQKLSFTDISIVTYLVTVDQIRIRYPEEWLAFISNCNVIQCIGPQSFLASTELAAVFGIEPSVIKNLKRGDILEFGESGLAQIAETKINTNDIPIPKRHRAIFAPSYSDKWEVLQSSFLECSEKFALIIEADGKLYNATSMKRSNISKIVKIDPFNVIDQKSDKFNPLDILQVQGMKTNVYEFVDELSTIVGSVAIDSFWDNNAIPLIRSILQYLFAIPEKQATLSELWRIINSDDTVYNLAVVLDTLGKKLPKDCYAEIAAFLQMSDSLRSRTIQEANKIVKIFSSSVIQKITDNTTFNLNTINTEGLTVYIEIPMQFMSLYSPLIKLWLSAFTHLSECKASEELQFLYVIDNCSELGLFPQLKALQKIDNHYVKLCAIWESPHQLTEKYPADWSAFLSNFDEILAGNYNSAPTINELIRIFGISSLKSRQLRKGNIVSLWDDQNQTDVTENKSDGIIYPYNNNRVTFASTRTNKWDEVSKLMQAEFANVVVVLESSAQCYRLTAEKQRESSQVILLDPFGVTGLTSDQFNPLDLLYIDDNQLAGNSLFITELLYPEQPIGVDPFWRASSYSLIYAMLLYLSIIPEKDRNIGELLKQLSHDDVVYNLAVTLDTNGKSLSEECYKLLAAFLSRADLERASILTITTQMLRVFSNPLIAKSVAKSSFDISRFFKGDPITIYIEIPTLFIPQHRLLIELWLGSLFRLCNLTANNNNRFIFDDQFSNLFFPIIKTAQNSNFANVWTFWESLDQLRVGRSAEWSAFLANAQIVEAFGPQNKVVANELALAFGHMQNELNSIKNGKSIVL
ncbi:MAG: type IV secretory system conjugative DNA transfer family protein [Flavobacterium sp.]|nr:type IV secretory system conjugative DNA transfer family protein [Flavobacterium sp.]